MNDIKELVILSGKGGTGKTTIVSAFAALSKNKIMTDCDVDAADLHLILKPEIKYKEDFTGSSVAVRDKSACVYCNHCFNLCKFQAINKDYNINEHFCEGCGVCAYFCPSGAITMVERKCGEIFISDTRSGPFVYGKLEVGGENSGKLVTKIKKTARSLAEKNNYNLIITDGSPGTGCPVISSIAGSSLVLIVTEPTVSGLHDMERVVELTERFNINRIVCINKYDINIEMTEKIEEYCRENSVQIAGRIHYDNITTKAMIESKSVVEYSDNILSKEIKNIWNKITDILKI